MKIAKLKGKIARWVGELQQFDFEVAHRPGASMKDADAMSRLAIMLPDSHEEANVAKIWEGTEVLQRTKNGRVAVPTSLVPKILELYHDSPESGGHDGFWRTYMKLTKRFSWPRMKQETKEYVLSCHTCKINKVKFKQPTQKMLYHNILPHHLRLFI